MKTRNTLLLAALVAVAGASRAGAQASTVNCGGSGELVIGATAAASTCAVSNNLSATVPSVARLTLSSSATTLTAPRAVDFGTGGSGNNVTTVGPSLTVAANIPYSIVADAPNFFAKDGNPSTKPKSDMTFSTDGTTFNPIGGTIASGAAATDGTSLSLTYGTKYNWTVDTPGTYTLAVTFTLTSP